MTILPLSFLEFMLQSKTHLSGGNNQTCKPTFNGEVGKTFNGALPHKTFQCKYIYI